MALVAEREVPVGPITLTQAGYYMRDGRRVRLTRYIEIDEGVILDDLDGLLVLVDDEWNVDVATGQPHAWDVDPASGASARGSAWCGCRFGRGGIFAPRSTRWGTCSGSGPRLGILSWCTRRLGLATGGSSYRRTWGEGSQRGQ